MWQRLFNLAAAWSDPMIGSVVLGPCGLLLLLFPETSLRMNLTLSRGERLRSRALPRMIGVFLIVIAAGVWYCHPPK